MQNYAWGKVGQDSEVAKLVVGGDPLAVVEDGKPYAEVRLLLGRYWFKSLDWSLSKIGVLFLSEVTDKQVDI